VFAVNLPVFVVDVHDIYVAVVAVNLATEFRGVLPLP
jgi:hypothetical protein